MTILKRNTDVLGVVPAGPRCGRRRFGMRLPVRGGFRGFATRRRAAILCGLWLRRVTEHRDKDRDMASTGRISQVIGSTFDAQFAEDKLPDIYNALEVELSVDGQKHRLVGEVQQHLGGGRVRAVALGSTDGLKRGMPIVDTGESVAVPVGDE